MVQMERKERLCRPQTQLLRRKRGEWEEKTETIGMYVVAKSDYVLSNDCHKYQGVDWIDVGFLSKESLPLQL